MTKYTMPVLSEQERESEIERCIADIWQLETTLKNGTSDNPHHIKSALVRWKIALAALTAKPVAWGVNDTRCHTHEGAGYFPLYEIPPVTVKQEGEQRD